MDKLVYLFELDSVRKTKEEIEHGQHALYDEIVMHGNTVVCTFNQISDSPSFLAILSDDKKYRDFRKLINFGKIRISRYGTMRTPSQYIQQNLLKNINEQNQNAFIFSSLPITYNEILKQKYIYDALINSDLSIFNEKINSLETTEQEIKELTILSRFVELIITFSMQKTTINEPKIDKKISMSEYIDKIFKIDNFSVKNYLDISKSCNILKSLDDNIGDLRDNRSVWINTLHKSYEKQQQIVENDAMQIAEAIIDLCYNYTLEDSILGVSKHYKSFDINAEDSFYNDFFNRLKLYMASSHNFLQTDSKELTYNSEVNLPEWDIAVSIIEQTKESEKNKILNSKKLINYMVNLITRKKRNDNNPINYYENNFKIELISWNILIIINLMTRTIFVIFGIGLFFIFTNLSNLVQEKTIELLINIPDYMKTIFNIF
ncbi:MAG: hypothetical protein ACJAWW_001936, partial [Sulfurimonas sp.]